VDIQEHALLITHAHHAHASRTPVRTHQHARLYAHMGSSAFHRPSSKTVSLWHTRIRRTAFKVHTRAPTQAPTRRLTRRLARTFHRPTYLPGKQSHSSALEDTGRPSKFTCTSTPVTGTRALFTGPRTCPENSRTRAPSKTQEGLQSSHALARLSPARAHFSQAHVLARKTVVLERPRRRSKAFKVHTHTSTPVTGTRKKTSDYVHSRPGTRALFTGLRLSPKTVLLQHTTCA